VSTVSSACCINQDFDREEGRWDREVLLFLSYAGPPAHDLNDVCYERMNTI
jgi:hypothetical protein